MIGSILLSDRKHGGLLRRALRPLNRPDNLVEDLKDLLRQGVGLGPENWESLRQASALIMEEDVW